MSELIWHDVECGGYSADLPLWEELAEAAGGPILDLGCGSGRVALHLARRGHRVVGLDLQVELLAALGERADGLAAAPLVGDARSFRLETDVALALAPMQLIQLLDGPRERADCLRCTAAHLRPQGRIALAIVEEDDLPEGGAQPLPDVREVDGWVYSSLPLDVAVDADEIAIRRLRQTVSPAGEISEEPNEVRIRPLSASELEREAEGVGLATLERREIPATEFHVGSTVVVLGRDA